MRVTAVVRRQHLGNQFKLFWMVQARRRVREDGTSKVLAAKGFSVIDPQEILTPAYPRKTLEAPIPPKLEEVYAPRAQESQNTPCHVFTYRFSPIMGLRQAQVLTNTLVHHSLPTSVLEHAPTSTPQEDDRVKEAILHSHLLDSHQEKLPRILDVINRPGWVDRREWGIPLRRINKSLTYQLLLLLDQLEGGVERQLVEDASTVVMLNHSDRLMQMKHDAAYLLSSPWPLPPLASPQEVQQLSSTQQLPDLYPMSPFINCRAINTYTPEERYGVDSPRLHPHTIFIHHNQARMPHQEDTFSGNSLLYAFSHAAAYAKLVRKDQAGDLKDPVVVHVVHTNRRHYHFGVFQLNTLNLSPTSSSSSPATRNIFWTQGWDTLFDSCQFKAAQPVLEGYNPKVFSLLRGLHAQG